MNHRAYTYIDRAQAVVGNRWIERTWSAFLGNTISLVQKDGQFEWLGRRSNEFQVVVEDEEPFEALDFGETAWSEENSTRGATLVSVQRRPGLELEIRTTALHDHPAMIRAVTIRNTSIDPVALVEVIPERLPLVRDHARVYTEDFSQKFDGGEWNTDKPAAAVVHEDRGVFFGRQGGGRFHLFDTDTTECSVRVPGPGLLGRGELWRTAPTFIIPFIGDVREAAATSYSQFLMRFFTQNFHEPPKVE